MVYNQTKLDEVNVLASSAGWAWPVALKEIFQPRGVNLLMAEKADEFVNVIKRRRIHTAIVDRDSEKSSGVATVRIIRLTYPLLPCIMLAEEVSQAVLSEALQLEVFSVIGKPVDMSILQKQLNRLFVKMYDSDIFG